MQVLEAADQLDSQPRATHYSPPAVRELRRAGLIEDILAEGFIPNGIAWRKANGTLLGELAANVLPADYPDKMICLPLDRLGKILTRHIATQPTVEVKYSHKVVKLAQTEMEASVVVETKDGELTLSADFVVGCDGANSQVRRSLFGDREFPGKTWDKQIVATNVRHFRVFNIAKTLLNLCYFRFTTILMLMAGTTPTLSLIPNIGLWRRAFPKTVNGESLMETLSVYLVKNISSGSQRNFDKCFQEILTLRNTA